MIERIEHRFVRPESWRPVERASQMARYRFALRRGSGRTGRVVLWGVMTASDPLPLVRVEHLSKSYAKAGFTGSSEKQIPAIDDISFDIAQGETLGLVGHSGSGKTTVGRTMLRLVEPTGGRVSVHLPRCDVVDLMTLDAAALRAFRRNMQMVFQDPFMSLNPRLTVREAVEEPLRVHNVVAPGDLADRATQLLEQVGLNSDVLAERPGVLSGGQRQRVGIARAIATEPCFVVADEPVTSLDVSVQAQILNLLSDLGDQLGLSYLFISHDLAVVEQMADRVAVLANGRIVEVGETGEVLANPRHPQTATLVQAARRMRIA